MRKTRARKIYTFTGFGQFFNCRERRSRHFDDEALAMCRRYENLTTRGVATIAVVMW